MFRRTNFLIVESENEKIELIRMRRQLRDKSNPLSLPTHIFVQRFRLSKEAFVMVLETVNLSNGFRSTYIPPIIRLALTLETLGSGGYQWLAGCDFALALAQSTVSKIITTTTNILEEKLCALWIKWRVSNEIEKAETKQWFYRKFGVPGVVGCIDGTHIFLQRPRENEQTFFNRKGKHSLNTMIICDHKMRIMAINSRYGGCAHDSFVWKHSNEKAFFDNII